MDEGIASRSTAPGTARPLEGLRVLVVEDDDHVRRALTVVLKSAGAWVRALPDALHALSAIADDQVDIVLTDVQMPHVDGIQLLREVTAAHPNVAVIVMTGHATVALAVDALRLGAFDFLTKPLSTAAPILSMVARAGELRLLRRRNHDLEVALAAMATPTALLTTGATAMRAVLEAVERVAPYTTTVLILGETGTGKELIARAVHQKSPRANRPWVAVNTSALPEALLESELFGHVKGAFTGADSTRDGLFQTADGGTLFLDEIGELPLSLQAKLLRVLQESEVRRVGASTSERVNVRVVAATHVDLKKAVAAGRFREDLYYRLDVVSVRVPPLRERMEDLPLLAAHFVRQHALRMGRRPPTVPAEALAALQSRSWPGNIRELENTLERAVVMTRGDTLDIGALQGTEASAVARTPAALFDLPLSAAREAAMASFDRAYLEALLARSGGNVSEAARAAGMERANFRRLLKRYMICATEFLRP